MSDLRMTKSCVKSCLVTGILLAALSATGCGSNAAAGRLPIGNVDTPKPGETVKGPVRLSGWALSEKGIDRVDAYLDRDLISSSHTGASRPDVQAVHPEFGNSATAGFDFPLDLTAKNAGNHTLIVQVHAADGGVKEIGNVPIVVNP